MKKVTKYNLLNVGHLPLSLVASVLCWLVHELLAPIGLAGVFVYVAVQLRRFKCEACNYGYGYWRGPIARLWAKNKCMNCDLPFE